MRKLSINTTTYDAGDGFCVDLVNDLSEKMFHAYLYHEGYGIKELMFGVPYVQPSTGERETLISFAEMVEANLAAQPYKAWYREQYMDVNEQSADDGEQLDEYESGAKAFIALAEALAGNL